jgi:hemerythrin-like metal-binding protein
LVCQIGSSKDPWPDDQAIAFIKDRRGTQFDPAVVDAFFEVLAMRSRAANVEWDERIAIDHPMVDQDHRILLQMINQIANPENANDPTAVAFVLDELVNYTHFHFTREEQLLAKAGYPNFDEHRQIHADMIADVEELRDRFNVQNEDVGGELAQYLTMWLVNHIMYEDRLYRPFVVGKL